MSKQMIKEVTQGELTARVNKFSGREIYEVDCHEGTVLIKREIANSETAALTIATDWTGSKESEDYENHDNQQQEQEQDTDSE